MERASRDKVYRENRIASVIRAHGRNVAIIPWKHYCGNARNRLGRFWCDWYGRTTVAYRCAITIETSGSRECLSSLVLIVFHINLHLNVQARTIIAHTTISPMIMHRPIWIVRSAIFSADKLWIEKRAGDEQHFDSCDELARRSLLSLDNSHRFGVTQHCVNIVFVQCLWCNTHYGDCSIRENVYRISPYSTIFFIRVYGSIVAQPLGSTLNHRQLYYATLSYYILLLRQLLFNMKLN